MRISPDIIKDYLVEKFTDYKVAGDEFLVDSIYVADTKKHMSINMETGLWQDFKSSRQGNFAHLVATLEGLNRDAAIKFLRAKLLDCPENLFASPIIESSQKPLSSITVKNEFKNFAKLNVSKFDKIANIPKRTAINFIRSRKLSKFKFYFGKEGKYKNRLIIPYTENGNPYYFQARAMSPYGMKYLNPTTQECGVKSSDILFPFDESMNYIIVTEGPLDAITLQVNGYNATCTQGSNLSITQLDKLKGRDILISYDNDFAGDKGVEKANELRLTKNMPKLSIIRPPSKYKDWNEFLVEEGSARLCEWVDKGYKVMNFDYQVTSLLS